MIAISRRRHLVVAGFKGRGMHRMTPRNANSRSFGTREEKSSGKRRKRRSRSQQRLIYSIQLVNFSWFGEIWRNAGRVSTIKSRFEKERKRSVKIFAPRFQQECSNRVRVTASGDKRRCCACADAFSEIGSNGIARPRKGKASKETSDFPVIVLGVESVSFPYNVKIPATRLRRRTNATRRGIPRRLQFPRNT